MDEPEILITPEMLDVTCSPDAVSDEEFPLLLHPAVNSESTIPNASNRLRGDDACFDFMSFLSFTSRVNRPLPA